MRVERQKRARKPLRIPALGSCALVLLAGCTDLDVDGSESDAANGGRDGAAEDASGGASRHDGAPASPEGGAPEGGAPDGSGGDSAPRRGGGDGGDGGGGGDGGDIVDSGEPADSGVDGGGTSDAASDAEDGAAADGAAADPCPSDFICAVVRLPADFPGDAERLALVLYADEPTLDASIVPSPDYRYGVVQPAGFGAGDSEALRQDFTMPLGDDFAEGSYYVGLLVFKSSATQVPEAGTDYWYVTPTAQVLALGGHADLGEVSVEMVPPLDDITTPGNDLPGLVRCHETTPCDVSAGNQCCIIINSTSSCIPAGDACSGPYASYVASCDGPEDCAGGEICCGDAFEAHGCAAACDSPRDRVCHSDADCEDGAACLRRNATYGYAYCDAEDPATPGDDRTGHVTCGATSCDVETLFCCHDTDVCASSGCNGPGSQQFYCDGPEDCASGQRCTGWEGGTMCCEGASCLGAKCHVDSQCPAGQVCNTNGTCVAS